MPMLYTLIKLQRKTKTDVFVLMFDLSDCHAPWLTLKSHLGKTCLGVIRSNECVQSTNKMMNFKVRYITFYNIFIYNVFITVNWANTGLPDNWLLKLDTTTWDHRGPMGALHGMTQEVRLHCRCNAN